MSDLPALSGTHVAIPNLWGIRLEPLNRLLAQPAVRSSLPAIGGVGAILLAGAAWYAFQSPSQRAVFEGLADSDKAAVADALQTSGIAHAVDASTGSVTVGEADFYKARMMLAARGLPKAAPSGDAMLTALPMGASRAVEGETLRSAREADIARTIEAVETVRVARVHLALPESSPFIRDQATASASVMLTLQTGRTLSETQVRAIGHLVASSVPGLNADHIAIVDQSGKLLSQAGSVDDRNLALQTEIEDRTRHSVDSLLLPILGADNYSTEIHADLDPNESQSTRESYPKDDRALRREEGNRTSGGSASMPAMGIPGTLSNQAPPASQVAAAPGGALTPPAQAGAAPSTATSNDETYSRSFDVGREISVTHQPTGKLRRVSVAVALRELKGAKPRSPQEIAVIENLVKGAVGFDAARGDVVAIASRPFVDAQIPDPIAFYDRPWFMALIRQAGALLAALLVFIFVGRPLFKALRKRAGKAELENELAQQLLAATPSRATVTLDMIEAAPSYEARANLVRDFVSQDSAKAASVIRQLMEGNRNVGH